MSRVYYIYKKCLCMIKSNYFKNASSFIFQSPWLHSLNICSLKITFSVRIFCLKLKRNYKSYSTGHKRIHKKRATYFVNVVITFQGRLWGQQWSQNKTNRSENPSNEAVALILSQPNLAGMKVHFYSQHRSSSHCRRTGSCSEAWTSTWPTSVSLSRTKGAKWMCPLCELNANRFL